MASVNTCPCGDCRATSKACKDCGETKPLAEFYQHAMMGDGHLNKCKDCVREYQRRRHREKIENDPVWRREERIRSRIKFRRNGHLWASGDPEKRAASNAVCSAVRDGRLTPSGFCEDCGHDFSEFRREAHHSDYSKVLAVEWLCSLCHGKRHRMSESEVA